MTYRSALSLRLQLLSTVVFIGCSILTHTSHARADVLEPLNTDPTLETWGDYMSPTGAYALASFWGSDDGTFIWTAADGAVALPDYLGFTLYASTGSNDGSILAGTFTDGGGKNRVFVMDNGVVTQITPSDASDYYVWTMSADGSAVAGTSSNAGVWSGYHWNNGVFQTINIPASFHTSVRGMSGNGQTVLVSNLFGDEYTWNAGVFTQLEEIQPGAYTTAKAISTDGTIVAGYYSYFDGVATQTHASRWVNNTHEDLGIGSGSYATQMSPDGQNIAGEYNSDTFLWQNGVVTNLGHTGDYSFPMAINNDGSVVVGFNESVVGFSTIDDPYYWTADDGMQSFAQILADNAVDTTGWDLNNYAGMYITNDGETVYSTALYNGTYQAYFFRPNGLISAEELAQSLVPANMPAQQVQAASMGNMRHGMMVARNALPVYLNTPQFAPVTVSAPAPQIASTDASTPAELQNIAPAAGGDITTTLRALPRRATYATGTIGTGVDDEFTSISGNATAGVMTAIEANTAIGIGVLASHHSTETRFGGDSSTRTAGVNTFIAHEGNSGVNVYATASVAAIDIASDRNYINGAAIDTSSGETSGMTYSTAVKVGYEIPVHDKAKIMPYGEVDASYTSIDGYTERGGGFPATIGDRDDTYLASRMGLEISHDLSNDLTVRGQGAWGHRWSDEGGVTASAAGITQYIPDSASGSDWAEAGIGINKYLSSNAVVTLDLAGRSGSTSEPDISATVGMVWNWN